MPMEFTAEAAHLGPLLKKLIRVPSRKTTIPVLSHFLLEVDVPTLGAATLKVRATDLDIEISDQITVEKAVKGAVTVPAHTLHDMIAKLDKGATVSVAQAGNAASVTVKSGKSRFTLQTLEAIDFPILDANLDDAGVFTVAAGELVDAIGAVSFAMSSEETRYYLCGVLIEEGDPAEPLRFVATDGHRLARRKVETSRTSPIPRVIVPRAAIDMIRSTAALADKALPVTVHVTDSKVVVDIGDARITSKLIDGTFPDYERVIPQNNRKRAIVSRDALAVAVDRVLTITSERTRAVALEIAKGGGIRVAATNPDGGDAADEIDSLNTDEIAIGFNGRYLLDCLAAIDVDDVTIKLDDPSSPTRFLPGAHHDDGAEFAADYVLMPMRI